MLAPVPPPAAEASGRPSAAKAWLRALERTGAIDSQPARLLPHVIEEQAAARGDAPALLSADETFTFAELAARARLYARWALEQGLGKGEVVALMMPNRPEYLAIWLGITRTGAVAALINTNLTGPALAHCLDAAVPRHVIAAAELAEVIEGALAGVGDPPTVWIHGEAASGRPRIDEHLSTLSDAPLSAPEQRDVTLSDTALLIYTSGTTGLPKAARVSHHRLMMWSHWFAGMAGYGPGDRLYNCLPMYHSTGGVVATGALLVASGSVVIRDGFSASRFWDEVTAFDCTVFQYIGELCRYLLAAPPCPAEQRHRLRLACGNGLRKDVWLAFEARFRIPWILEFYASTEGNFSLFNAEGEPGAIGRIPGFLRHRFPAAVVEFDPDAGTPLRDAHGRCVRCKPGEPGEAIGRIDTASLAQRFDGYTDPAANAAKVLRDVFEEGDAWLRTGDLMRVDARGFFTFIDRIGETFRWKGENVATTEVADVLMACDGVEQAIVYGVQVPGAEGRAGMAALVTAPNFDLERLHAHLAARLPAYARPVFLRLVPELARTETFKTKAQDLAREGFGTAQAGAEVYVSLGAERGYTPLTGPLLQQLMRGAARL